MKVIEVSASPSSSPPSARVASIDALRGLDILVMIFVNDIAGIVGIPWWMEHYRGVSDGIENHYLSGMTFVDVVFPAFLFIVGMSIPFAIGRRLERGEAPWRVWAHILSRTLGLLIAGVFMVNDGSVDAESTGMSRPMWTLLMYLGVLAAWCVPPSEPGLRRNVFIGLRFVGAVLLTYLAVIFRAKMPDGSLRTMRPEWWGILGLIGWAYLVACLFYVPLRRRPELLACSIGLLICMFLADRAGLWEGFWLDQWVDLGSMLGSHSSITVAGVLLGVMLTPQSPTQTHEQRLKWASSFALILAVTGVLLIPLHGVNKNAATPAWCLLCSAITIWTWMILHYLLDVRGWTGWAIIIRPAGENPLMAYILAPILHCLFAVLGVEFYDNLGASFTTGLWRSIIFAFFVTWLAGTLKWAGLRLRL